MSAGTKLVVWACFFALAFARCARADLVDEERRAQWDLWREEPLDLRSAAEEEIEMLPGSDARLAASVVVLREAGRLPADLDTLVALLAASTELAEQWRDLVRVEPPEAGLDAGADLRSALLADHAAAAEARSVLQVRTGPVRGAMGGRSSASAPGRGWAALDRGSLTLVAGHLRPHTGEGLLLADAAVRSRTGAVRPPGLPGLAGRSGSSLTEAAAGVGAMWTGRNGRAWVARLRPQSGGSSWAGAAAHTAGQFDVGISWASDEARTRAALWTAQGGRRGPAWWASLAAGHGDPISHAGARWAGSGWRAGAAFTRAPAPGAAGHDPISGSSLDRPHRSWQIDAALHQRGWSCEVLARHTARGHPGADTRTERGRLRWEWRPVGEARDRARWRTLLEVGIDEAVAESGSVADPPATTQRVSVERAAGAHRFVGVWRRSGRAGSRQEAIALRFGLDRSAHWSAAVAIAGGERSTPWSVLQPGWGTAPLWVQPGGMALSAGVRAREGGRLDLGFWTWWRAGPRSSTDFGGGASVRLRVGSAGAIVAR